MDGDAEAIFREHCLWGQRFCKEFKRYTSWDNERDAERVLKIGYLSADFFTHSVSYFIEAPLAFRNPLRTHTTCYSNVARYETRRPPSPP
jgi:protein O-GlcNAc transferase